MCITRSLWIVPHRGTYGNNRLLNVKSATQGAPFTTSLLLFLLSLLGFFLPFSLPVPRALLARLLP